MSPENELHYRDLYEKAINDRLKSIEEKLDRALTKCENECTERFVGIDVHAAAKEVLDSAIAREDILQEHIEIIQRNMFMAIGGGAVLIFLLNLVVLLVIKKL